MSENIIATCAEAVAPQSNNVELSVWVPAIISVISLIVTTIFTIFISPVISEKHNQKNEMYKICAAFFDYLTDIVSFDTYEGVPSQIRKYSLKIHLMFKSGIAPQKISNLLERIFQLVKERKKLTDESEILTWEKTYREKVRELRLELSKYVGVFK